MSHSPKIIAVVGPTASGKSELAVKLAKLLHGEIISADSRQIYKGLDIGSGKVEGQWLGPALKKVFTYKNIPHHLIDEANPARQFSVSSFQRKALTTIKTILGQNKVPIICGGTGHWIDALMFQETLPQVKPNLKLRKYLEQQSNAELYHQLLLLDPRRAGEIDPHNPRRLIRALEIIHATGKPIPAQSKSHSFATVYIGINPGMEVLEQKILKRLKDRIKQGMIQETQRLHEQGLSWKKLEGFGLEYKFTAQYLQGKITKTEMEQLLYTAIRQYAKRQLTWFKRNKHIHWFTDEKSALAWAKNNLQ